MLPKRWQFRIGAITTALSVTGLAWSLGYRISLRSHVGWPAAAILMTIGAVVSVLVQIPRERWVPYALYRIADLIEQYVEQNQRRMKTEGGQLTDRDWRKIAARYREDFGNLAFALANEIYGYNSEWIQLARTIKTPKSLEEMAQIAPLLNGIADSAPKWWFGRMIVAAFQGLVLGSFAFFVFRFVVTRMF